ncbi:MAG: CPBP family intramembrane glutamic endopeptidase [Pseudomonadota bacterium]
MFASVKTIDWMILFTPGVLAMVGGLGFWLHVRRKSATDAEAAVKFKPYTWLYFPAVSAVYAGIVIALLDAADRSALFSALSLTGAAPLIGLACGTAAGLASALYIRVRIERRPEEAAFLSPEYRELPGLVIVAPIAEELIFRGYGRLAFSDDPQIIAMLVTSAAFALIHGKVSLMLISFGLGCALYALFIVTGNLAAPIAAHATANLVMWINDRYIMASRQTQS